MGDGGERFVHETRWRAEPEPTDEMAVTRQSNWGELRAFQEREGLLNAK